MFGEILLVVCVALGGAIFTLFLQSRFPRRQTFPKQVQNITPKQQKATKSEIESLEFERSILSHSITSSYEFAQGNSMSQERDHLVAKYQSQLDTINKRIGELQLSIEFSELSEARNKLVSLLQAKITSLDGRLNEMSHKYGLSIDKLDEDRNSASMIQYQEKKEHPTSSEASIPMAEFPENKAGDMDVKEVQREILEALNKLENVGSDYELLTHPIQQEADTSTERQHATSYPLNSMEGRDNNTGNNITMDLRSVGRDAISSIIRDNPSQAKT